MLGKRTVASELRPPGHASRVVPSAGRSGRVAQSPCAFHLGSLIQETVNVSFLGQSLATGSTQ